MQNSSQLGRLWMVAHQEFRLLLRERSLWTVGGLFLLLIGYALVNGMVQTSQREQAQAALSTADKQAREEQLAQLRRVLAGEEVPTPFGNPANPANMAGGLGAQFAIMPSAALAPVALGQTDLYPSQFKVTHQSKVNFLHNNDIENPWHLLSGHFDLAFVVVYLMPLLIFALSYNVLSAEKEDGTLRLLVSQPLALTTLIAGKIAVRAAVLLGAAVLVPLLVLLLARPQALAAPSVTLWWAALVGAYALFWLTAVVAVNAFGRSSATNAMVLIIGWVLLVLVVPVVLNIVVTWINPAPSRAELATRTRVVTAQAMSNNAALLATDYEHVDKPEVLVPKDGRLAMSGRAMANYRIQREVDESLRPELERFDSQQARQQELVTRYSALSPAAVAFEGLTSLAGTGQRRNGWFLAQIADFHEQWKQFFYPRIDGGLAMSEADIKAIPRFTWREENDEAVQSRAAVAVLQLVVPALAFLAIAVFRLRRYRVV